MAVIPRIDRLAPGLFPDTTYIDDYAAAQIAYQISARWRFDDLGAIVERWKQFSEGSRMRFGWLMTAATQLRLWNDPNNITSILPRWKSEVMEARDRLIKIFSVSELPLCFLSEALDLFDRKDDPFVTSLEAYAKATRLLDDYSSEARGGECLEKAALLLKQAADLMASLPTEGFQDFEKLCSLRLSLYDQSRAIFRDAVGGRLSEPAPRAFISALDLKIREMTSSVNIGAIMFDIKKIGNAGGGGMGSLPPTGAVGGHGPAGGAGAASAKGLQPEESATADGAIDDSDAESTDPYGLELGAETALFGVVPLPVAPSII